MPHSLLGIDIPEREGRPHEDEPKDGRPGKDRPHEDRPSARTPPRTSRPA
jgi:hypothetical protein